MCNHLKLISKQNKYPTLANDYAVNRMLVPCGTCVDCLKRRQKDYSTRIYREAYKANSMFFVTLTYRNDTLPLAFRVYKTDVDTGEAVDISPYEFLPETDGAAELRRKIVSKRSTSVARRVQHEICRLSHYVYIAEVTPSLRRFDFRIWLKKSRIQWKREQGYNMDFKYAVCGEYGPRGCRPHMHAIFLNIKKEELDFLLSRWREAYGYTYSKEVPLCNPDGSSARYAVASYIGKYISKGKFDCDSVKERSCEKGRLCNSRFFGNNLTDEEIAYFRGYDIVGYYDINNFSRLSSPCDDSHFTGSYLEDFEREKLVAELVKRNRILLPGSFDKNGNPRYVALPQYLRKRLYYVKDVYYDKDNKEYKVRYVASSLSAAVASKLRDNFIAEHQSIYRRLYPDQSLSKVSLESFIEIKLGLQSSEKSQSEIKEENRIYRQYFTNQKDKQ